MKNVDFKSGKIIYNEFNIDFKIPFSKQLDTLLEDLMQIEYMNGYLIDLGWYPEYISSGSFIVQVVKDYNWESPLYKRSCKSQKQLEKVLRKAINIASNEYMCDK